MSNPPVVSSTEEPGGGGRAPRASGVGGKMWVVWLLLVLLVGVLLLEPRSGPSGPTPTETGAGDPTTQSDLTWEDVFGSGDVERISRWYEASTGVTGYWDARLGRRLRYADLRTHDAAGGFLETTHDGQTIEKIDLTNSRGIRIRHSGVTVRAVRIVPVDAEAQSVGLDPEAGVTDTTLEYLTIDGSGQGERIAGTLWDTNARYLNVRGHRSGFHLGSDVVLEYSYIHDQVVTSGSHNTAISSHGGQSDVLLRRNLLEGSTSSAVSLYPDRGPFEDYTIEENVLIGNDASYAMYGGCTDSKPYGDENVRVRVKRNLITSGRYGVSTWACTSPEWGPGHEWDQNRTGNERQDP